MNKDFSIKSYYTVVKDSLGQRPLIQNLVKVIYETWRKQGEEEKHMRDFERDKYTSLIYSNTIELLYKLFRYRPKGPYGEQVESYLNFMADNLEAPTEQVEENAVILLEVMVEEEDKWHNLSYIEKLINDRKECTAQMLLASEYGIWLDSLAMLLLEDEDRPLLLGDLLEFSYNSVNDYQTFKDAPFRVYPNGANESNTYPDHVLSTLMGLESEISAHDVVEFALNNGLKSIKEHFNKGLQGSLCQNKYDTKARLTCIKENIGDEYLRQGLGVLKYVYQPSYNPITTGNYLTDTESALRGTNYSMRCDLNVSKDFCRHSDPIVRDCSFGYAEISLLEREDSHDDCRIFQRTFGYQGLAYTFNPPDYWSIYANNTYNRAFYDEVYVQDSKEEKPGMDHYSSQKKLDFFVNLETVEKLNKNPPSPSLSIHHPSQIPNIPLTLELGYRYTITVLPTIITTDNTTTDISEEKRQCRFSHEPPKYPKGTNMFATYSQSSCLLECGLKKAFANASCLPWDFPHFEDPISICAWNDHFNSIHRDISADNKECDCPADCDVYNYGLVISKTPLKATQECYHSMTRPVHPIFKFLAQGEYTFDQRPMKCSDGWDKLLARVTVQMDTCSVTRTRRMRRTTLTDQVASLGGVVALFTGMSMLSLMEMLVWTCRALTGLRGDDGRMSSCCPTCGNKNSKSQKSAKEDNEKEEENEQFTAM